MLVEPPIRKKIDIRKYNDDIIKKLLENNIPDKAEGEEIYIPDSSNLPMSIFPKANTYQKTREGDNLINVNCSNQTLNNVNLINNHDGSVTLNGTATNNTGGLTLLASNTEWSIEDLPSELTFAIEGLTVENVDIALSYADDTGMWISNILVCQKANPIKSITLYNMPENAVYLRCNISVQNGVVFDNVTIRPMLLEGIYTAETLPPFEQYGQSPSIDYPSPIQYPGGEFESYNLFDKDLFETFTQAEKIIALSLKPNTNYTMSSNIPKASNSVANLFFKLQEDTISTGKNGIYNGKAITLTTDDTGIVNVVYRNYDIKEIDFKNNYWYQIVEGTSEKPYLPYGTITSEYEIETKNVNLLDVNDLSSLAINQGIKVDEDDYVYDETPTEDIRAWNYNYSNWKMTLPAGTYSLLLEFKNKITNTNGALQILTKTKRIAEASGNTILNKDKVNIKFTLNEETEIGIEFKVFDGKCRIWLLKDTELTSYIKHQSQTYNLKMSYKLAKCGEKEDKFKITYEQIGGYKKITKLDYIEETYEYILDGINNKFNSKTSSTKNNLFTTSTSLPNILKPSNDFNILEHYTNYSIANSASNIYNNNISSESAIRINGDFALGFGLESEIDTLQKANEWLQEKNEAGNPLKILYPLAQPNTINITDKTTIEQFEKLINLSSFEGGTHISSSSNIEEKNNLILSAEYFKSKFKELESKINNIEALLKDTEEAIEENTESEENV